MTERYSSSVSVPHEVAALAPSNFSVPSTGGFQDLGASLMQLGEQLNQSRIAREIAEATAIYNDSVDEYVRSLEGKDPKDYSFVDNFGYSEKNGTRSGAALKALEGTMTRETRQLLENKFRVWDELNAANIARFAISRDKEISNETIKNYMLNSVAHGQREEFRQELDNYQWLTPREKDNLMADYDRLEAKQAADIQKQTERKIENYHYDVAMSFENEAEAIAYANSNLVAEQIGDRVPALTARVRNSFELREQQEKQAINEQIHGIISKLQANDPTVADDINNIEDADDRQKWYKVFEESTQGDKIGNPILISQLKGKAREVGRGSRNLTELESEVQKAYQEGSLGRGTYANSAYGEIMDLAQTKYESWQDIAVNDSEGTAYRILQVGEAENAWQSLLARSLAGEKIDEAEMGRIARQRVLRAYAYDRWQNDITTWMKSHPQAENNEIRDAGVDMALMWSRKSLEEIEAMMGGPKTYKEYLKQAKAEKPLTETESMTVTQKLLKTQSGYSQAEFDKARMNVDYVQQLDSWMQTQSNIDSLPEDLVSDLQAGLRAVGNGADPKKVFERILEEYKKPERPKIKEFLATLIEPMTK